MTDDDIDLVARSLVAMPGALRAYIKERPKIIAERDAAQQMLGEIREACPVVRMQDHGGKDALGAVHAQLDFCTWAENEARTLRADLESARADVARLQAAAERVYDVLWANLDNMSQHNQDALRPAAMELLAALAGEPTALDGKGATNGDG